MTPQEMSRELAEKVLECRTRTTYGVKGEPVGFMFTLNGKRREWSPYKCDQPTWSPFTSRDHCAELLGKLTDEQWGRVERAILQVVLSDAKYTPSGGTLIRLALTATPAQISEAVWRATCQ